MAKKCDFFCRNLSFTGKLYQYLKEKFVELREKFFILKKLQTVDKVERNLLTVCQ